MQLHFIDRLLRSNMFHRAHHAMFLSFPGEGCGSPLLMVVRKLGSEAGDVLFLVPRTGGFPFLVTHSHSGLWLADGVLVIVLATVSAHHVCCE